MKDFYQVLEVAPTATADEIKKSYRKLAKKFHPDVTGGDQKKEARFKEISEAYETVGDAEKRKKYDEIRQNPFSGGFNGAPGGGTYQYTGGGGMPFDIEELLRQANAQNARGRGGGRGRAQAQGFSGGGIGDFFSDLFGGGGAAAAEPQRSADVTARLDLDLPEMALGAEKAIQVDGKKLSIKIPAGVTEGKTIRLQGQGHPGGRGATPGDLLIEVHERPHGIFRRSAPASADIEVDVRIPVDVAILGGKAQVPTLEGTQLSLTIPAGTSSGRKLRLREKGAFIDKKKRGDLYAQIHIQVPENLSEDAKKLMEEFAKATKL